MRCRYYSMQVGMYRQEKVFYLQKINKLSFTLIRCHKHIHGFSYFVVFHIKFSFVKVLLFVFPKIRYYFGFLEFISGCVANIHNRMPQINVESTRTRHRDISEITPSPYAGNQIQVILSILNKLNVTLHQIPRNFSA